MKRLRSSLGLTLVEMLVVMSICIISAALLVPFLLRSREEARCITCKNNLKNVGMAFHMIVPEREGYFTNSYYDIAKVNAREWWVGLKEDSAQLDPLMKADIGSNLVCPSAKGYVQTLWGSTENANVQVPTTYAYNVEMPIIARNMILVPEPTNRVLFYDGDPALLVGLWEHTREWPNRTILGRHRGKANFLHLDGRVETTGDFDALKMHGCKSFQDLDNINWGQLQQAPEDTGKSEWVLSASVDLHQESNNAKNKGNDLQCTVRLSGAGESAVDLDTTYLLGVVGHSFRSPVLASGPMSSKVDKDGNVLAQFKFDRQTVYEALAENNLYGDALGFKVVGELEDGRPFEGVDPNAFFLPPK